jgi:hypothetical protein
LFRKRQSAAREEESDRRGEGKEGRWQWVTLREVREEGRLEKEVRASSYDVWSSLSSFPFSSPHLFPIGFPEKTREAKAGREERLEGMEKKWLYFMSRFSRVVNFSKESGSSLSLFFAKTSCKREIRKKGKKRYVLGKTR